VRFSFAAVRSAAGKEIHGRIADGTRMLRGCVTLAAVLLTVMWALPAAADDDLTIVSGSFPTGFFVVIDDVAKYGGFFKEQHLNVDIDFTGSASTAVQLVAAGKGDITPATLEPVIQGYDKGVRLVTFLARDPHYEYVLGVLAGSPIKTLADFKGTQIGEYSAGSAAEVSTTAMLLGAGLKRSDFSYIPIGNGAQAISALTSGKVAGAAFPYAELAIYVTNANQKYRYFWNPILKDIPDVGYSTTPAILESKADQLRRFSRAVVEAAILIKVNPHVAARYFLQGAGIEPTADALAKETQLLEISQDQLPGFDPMSPTTGKLSRTGIGVLAQFLHDNGLSAEVVPTSALVTDRFLAYANDFDKKAFIARAKAMR
jgi:NitT/TauT family transport system substrate-binding protein